MTLRRIPGYHSGVFQRKGLLFIWHIRRARNIYLPHPKQMSQLEWHLAGQSELTLQWVQRKAAFQLPQLGLELLLLIQPRAWFR